MKSKSRRRFLSATAGITAGTLGWASLFRIPAASAQSTLAVPPGFPRSIPLYQRAFENWSGQIFVERVWTCAPADATDVVTIVNWAHQNGYRLRAKGMGHNWSPLLLPNHADVAKTVLVDTTVHLTEVRVNTAGAVKTVTAGAGTTMDRLLEQLEARGLGFAAIPSAGDLTVGGVLAVGAHGAAIRARGEALVPGVGYGSLSNAILSLTAVVWDDAQKQYVLRTFGRDHPDMRAFLVHLGRTFVTEVTLQVASNARVRCESWVDIPVGTVFAPPASAGPHSLAALVEQAGRVEVIWFPFTASPWIKVWSLAPNKPSLSREVRAPYNYPFANMLDERVSDLIEGITAGNAGLTPILMNLFMVLAATGLTVTGARDIWGWSKDVLLYVKPSTLRVGAAGYAVLTARSNVQRVVWEFYEEYRRRIAAYQAKGQFPMAGPIEIRVTGLDHAHEVQMPAAQSPLLSSCRPRPDHPEWDTCVWFDIQSIPAMPHADEFYSDLERWIWSNYSGHYATVRPNWPKGWGFSPASGWSDRTTLTRTIPDSFRAGQAKGDDWDTAVAILGAYDPNRIFSNAFLDTLFR
ncbi:FAD-binding protein [Pendulispora brunnea]|uniref:FAD-binding protein n=1 Tax=Pendulispora brunnea TaxID=2905690 RepID=A0ABZ2KCM3_9BACT